jgi:cyanate lyase
LRSYLAKKQTKSDFPADSKVYEAANLFEQENSKTDEVEKLLLSCIDFDEEDVKSILNIANRDTSNNSRYVKLLMAINQQIGKNVYKYN